MEGAAGGNAAPTGCYKCGRPGHWSRDCPSSAAPPPTSPGPAAASANPNPSSSGVSSPKPSSASFDGKAGAKALEKPKKVPRTRPKLTPDMLLSEDGLGYVLRHFPRHFKFRGRGHEVADLGNLISLYSEWHSHLLPHYSFDQFVQKVEQVGSTRRVKACIRELKQRVANGGDPSKLHEPPVELTNPNDEQGAAAPGESLEPEELNHLQEDPSLEGPRTVSEQEVMLEETHQKVTEEASQPLDNSTAVEGTPSVQELPREVPETGKFQSSKIQISEEQKARMEANRQKALERALARAKQL